MRRIVVMGAGGRDFHDFNMVYRDDPTSTVIAFTAAQIPGTADRVYPPQLAGPRYPHGIPIMPEAQLPAQAKRHRPTVQVTANPVLQPRRGVHGHGGAIM